MKKLLLILGIIILVVSTIMPVTAFGVRQGFQHPDKGWAQTAVYWGARLRMRCSRYQAAIPILERALKVWPNGLKADETMYWIGLCYERSGGSMQALTWYKAFVEKHPHHRWEAQAQRRIASIEASNLTE
ncbi:MAG: tetratricopeptide repeat protein [Lentisphaeria bacterium]|nr:tetratricopeptide repeat protein [Lentisphaeria bacterium]